MATLPIDTLVTDTAIMARWREDGSYNYGSELLQSDISFWEWLGKQLQMYLSRFFSWVTLADSNQGLWIVIAIVIAVAIALFIVIRHPSLFARSNKGGAIDYEVTEDNIYGIDFDALIRRALDRNDYRAAVRLVYLQTLRWLNDTQRIKWRKSKAPMQYAREVGTVDMRRLVTLFLRVRYGGYDCGREQVDEAMRYQRAICPADCEEGGEA